jgi:Putative peptidoglycan binding domain
MNHSKLILSLSCFVIVTLASPLLTAAPRGGGGRGGGGHFAGARGFAGRPGMGAWGGRNWNGRNWSGRNWNGNWHGHHGHNNVIFIGDFGFPGWWGWGWGPYWGYPYYGYGYGYPYGYGYYGYGDPGYGYGDYGYGNGYGYGYGNSSQYSSPTRSRVAELQRRLARAGYYRGSVDGILGPQTRRAIRAYETDHGYADAG